MSSSATAAVTTWIISLSKSVRCHEDRQAKIGKMMQRLVDPDQRPEPWVLLFLCHAERRGAKSLGTVDRDMDDEVDQGDEPEPRRDDQDQRQCNRKVHEAVRQQGQRPPGFLILADRHPRTLQHKVCN